MERAKAEGERINESCKQYSELVNIIPIDKVIDFNKNQLRNSYSKECLSVLFKQY